MLIPAIISKITPTIISVRENHEEECFIKRKDYCSWHNKERYISQYEQWYVFAAVDHGHWLDDKEFCWKNVCPSKLVATFNAQWYEDEETVQLFSDQFQQALLAVVVTFIPSLLVKLQKWMCSPDTILVDWYGLVVAVG